MTLTEPDPAGATAVTLVEFTTATEVASTSPKDTDVVPVRLMPVMVTDVPPEPVAGVTLVTRGSAAT